MKKNRSYLRELGPVKGFVALEELSCQVAVLPVHFLQSRSMVAKGEQHVVFIEIKSEASLCMLLLMCTCFRPPQKMHLKAKNNLHDDTTNVIIIKNQRPRR